jgi:lactobin A/cerein 7B family class IIb bacteriocin
MEELLREPVELSDTELDIVTGGVAAAASAVGGNSAGAATTLGTGGGLATFILFGNNAQTAFGRPTGVTALAVAN